MAGTKRIKDDPIVRGKLNRASPHEYTGCLTKRKFNKKQVRAYAARLGLNYYKCKFCHKYHLTHHIVSTGRSIESILAPLLIALQEADYIKEEVI
jgi:ribosomal protein L32